MNYVITATRRTTKPQLLTMIVLNPLLYQIELTINSSDPDTVIGSLGRTNLISRGDVWRKIVSHLSDR